MILWVDDVREPPNNEEYEHVRSVGIAQMFISLWELKGTPFTMIDIDHDAGDYAYNGGDYIRLLDWLEETGRNYPIRIHSMNPVGVQNMRQIIQRNGWREVR